MSEMFIFFSFVHTRSLSLHGKLTRLDAKFWEVQRNSKKVYFVSSYLTFFAF